VFSKTSVDLAKQLYDRARQAAAKAGYSSLEEFVQHAVEKELARVEEAESKEAVTQQLKGLGYLE
jgi:metal-responsive CopG/Arc/MetJ family transcriptional regulator